MGIETIIKGCLIVYWPEAWPPSKRTMMAYSLLEAAFDGSKVDEVDSTFRWSHENKAIIYVEHHVDFVTENILAIHERAVKALAKSGKLIPDKNINKYLFTRIDNISFYEDAVRLASIELVRDYLQNRDSSLN